MVDYVCGFMFSKSQEHVVLIKKQKPAFLKGLWNGVGGKIEEGEISVEAMVREFREETGVSTVCSDWDLFCDLRLLNTLATIRFFRCFSDKVFDVASMEAEKIGLLTLKEEDIGRLPLKENLHWLIPLALEEEAEYANVQGNQVLKEGQS